MPEIQYDKSHHSGATPEARINHRLGTQKPPGYSSEVTTQPTRTETCIYPSGGQGQHDRGSE
jgi:hypothetical protein